MIAPMLAVKDVDASVAFYTEKLGFQKIAVLEGLNGKSARAFVCMGELAQLGFSAHPTHEPVGNGVVFMIYPPKEVKLDQLYGDLMRSGVRIEQPLHEEYWGERSFSIKDPDGYCLTFSATEMTEPPDDIPFPLLNSFPISPTDAFNRLLDAINLPDLPDQIPPEEAYEARGIMNHV